MFILLSRYYNNAVLSEEIFKDMSSNIQQEILSLEMIETLLRCPLFQVLFLISIKDFKRLQNL